MKPSGNPNNWVNEGWIFPIPFYKSRFPIPHNFWIASDNTKCHADYLIVLQRDSSLLPAFRNGLVLMVNKNGVLSANSHLSEHDRELVNKLNKFVQYILSLHKVWQVMTDVSEASVMGAYISPDNILMEYKYE